MIFLVAGRVAACGGWVVLLALQVLGYLVVLERHAAGVLEDPQVGEDGTAPRQHPGLAGLELQIAADAGGEYIAAATLEPVLELDALPTREHSRRVA